MICWNFWIVTTSCGNCPSFYAIFISEPGHYIFLERSTEIKVAHSIWKEPSTTISGFVPGVLEYVRYLCYSVSNVIYVITRAYCSCTGSSNIAFSRYARRQKRHFRVIWPLSCSCKKLWTFKSRIKSWIQVIEYRWTNSGCLATLLSKDRMVLP